MKHQSHSQLRAAFNLISIQAHLRWTKHGDRKKGAVCKSVLLSAYCWFNGTNTCMSCSKQQCMCTCHTLTYPHTHICICHFWGCFFDLHSFIFYFWRITISLTGIHACLPLNLARTLINSQTVPLLLLMNPLTVKINREQLLQIYCNICS